MGAAYGKGDIGRLVVLSQAFMNHCEVLDMIADDMKDAMRRDDDQRVADLEMDFADASKDAILVFQKVQRHLVKITR